MPGCCGTPSACAVGVQWGVQRRVSCVVCRVPCVLSWGENVEEGPRCHCG
jgi:hypothetical protein